MQLKTSNLVIYDYEIDIMSACVLELEFYSQGLLKFPSHILHATAPWGVERRPGIVDIASEVHLSIVTDFAVRCFHLDFAIMFEQQLQRSLKLVYEINILLEKEISKREVKASTITSFFDRVYELMAFHVVNWMLPLGEFQSCLEDCLGSHSEAMACLKSFMVPSTPAHLSDFYLAIIESAELVKGGSWSIKKASDAARELGMLQAAGIEQTPLENPVNFFNSVVDFASMGNQQVIHQQKVALRNARDSANRRRNDYLTRALAASFRSDGVFSKVQAIETITRTAADAEEGRKVLQLRSLRNLRELLINLGLPIADTKAHDLISATTEKERTIELDGT